MKIINDNTRLVLLSAVTCVCVLFSVPNYSNEPGAPEEKTSAQMIQEYYLDFWYWMEGISLAQFMLSKERYAERPLELEDLKRIYTLSFTASHVLDPYLFNLRNGFYSAAYLEGKPYSEAELPDAYHQSHKEYIKKLHALHNDMSPYHTEKDLGKNFEQVFNDTYKDSYHASYQQFKQLIAHYDASSKPHISGLGENRAKQWLRYEITDVMYQMFSDAVAGLEDIVGYQNCLETLNQFNAVDPVESSDRCSSVLSLSSLTSDLEALAQRPLVKKLLPEICEQIQSLSGALAKTPVEMLVTAQNSLADFAPTSLQPSKTVEKCPESAVLPVKYEQLQMLTISAKPFRSLLGYIYATREINRPPYDLISTSLKFSRVKKLHRTGLNLHSISTLPLEELELLRDDLAEYRKTIHTRAMTPVILIRELGLTLKKLHHITRN